MSAIGSAPEVLNPRRAATIIVALGSVFALTSADSEITFD
jgi:hypothetical protein